MPARNAVPQTLVQPLSFSFQGIDFPAPFIYHQDKDAGLTTAFFGHMTALSRPEPRNRLTRFFSRSHKEHVERMCDLLDEDGLDVNARLLDSTPFFAYAVLNAPCAIVEKFMARSDLKLNARRQQGNKHSALTLLSNNAENKAIRNNIITNADEATKIAHCLIGNLRFNVLYDPSGNLGPDSVFSEKLNERRLYVARPYQDLLVSSTQRIMREICETPHAFRESCDATEISALKNNLLEQAPTRMGAKMNPPPSYIDISFSNGPASFHEKHRALMFFLRQTVLETLSANHVVLPQAEGIIKAWEDPTRTNLKMIDDEKAAAVKAPEPA